VLAIAAVAIVVAVLITRGYAGPGNPQLTTGRAARIFEEPFTSGLRSAHVTIESDNGIDRETSEGVVQFRPTRALELTTTSAGGYVRREIDARGVEYTLAKGARWTAGAGPSTLLWYTGWVWPEVPSPLVVAGQVRIGGALAWHLVSREAGGNVTGWWIREKDGYPLKISLSEDNGEQTYSYRFSQFSSSPSAIQAPSAGRISTRLVTGSVGVPLRLPWAQLEVTGLNRSYTGSGGPPPGYRFVAIHLLLRNTSGRAWTLDVAPGLVDGDGLYLDQIYSAAAPALPSQLHLAPGQTARGWLTFQVPAHDKSEILHVSPPENAVGGPLVNDLVAIPLS
jgi:hypothetical protein